MNDLDEDGGARLGTPVAGPGGAGPDHLDAASDSDASAIHAFAAADSVPGFVDHDSAVPVDVRAYATDPREVRRSDVDLAALSEPRLEPRALSALVHFAGVERQTIRLLRDVLVTPSHKESRVTAFLTTWAYEQYWIGDTLRAVLDANRVTPPAPGRLVRWRTARDDRVLPMYHALTTNLLGDDFVARHMVTGLLDTLVADLAYERLTALDPRPALADLVSKVRAAKAAHMEFYEAQARERLAHSPAARRLVRRGLRRWRWPGSRYMDRAVTRRAVRDLLGHPSCRARVAALDARVAALPGLAGLEVVRRAVARYGLGTGRAVARLGTGVAGA